jgi:NAD(P)H dehydrogenase (quinone)
MKHLIIYAHPNPESLNGQLQKALKAHLQENGHEVILRDLYALNFNPVLSLEDLAGQRRGTVAEEITIEQNHISWADIITFIYPIWWTGLPAIMKGYIDRVFSYGFAYSYDQGIQKGLLGGKTAIIVNTHGKSNEDYQANGLGAALSLTSDKGIYTYCDLRIKKHFFFDKADRANENNISQWKRELFDIYDSAD